MSNLSVKERRWIIKQRLRGAKVTWICGKAGISRDTFYYHWNNFQREGWSGLKVKSRRPKTIHRTPGGYSLKKHAWLESNQDREILQER